MSNAKEPIVPQKWWKRIAWFAFAFSPLVVFPVGYWSSTYPRGVPGGLLAMLVLAYTLAVFLAMIKILKLATYLPLRSTRGGAAFYLLVCLVLIASVWFGVRTGLKWRMSGIRAFTQRSTSLIAAIRSYESDNSTAPTTLEDLVPKYLPSIPTTGMIAYPGYRYFVGEEARKQYADNPWVLEVGIPFAIGNWDSIVYFPKQNYSEWDYYGDLNAQEPVNDWVYFHE